MDKKRSKYLNRESLTVGLTYFAIFFGAGNLIFPPYLGVISGENLWGFIGFILADVGLACVAIVSSSKAPEYLVPVIGRMGRVFEIVIVPVMMVVSCVLVIVPRTAASTFEIGFEPFVPNMPRLLFSAVYFAIVLFMVFKASKLVDNIGKYMCPFLVAAVAIMIIVGIVNPVGTASAEPQTEELFKSGLMSGYQTMDGISASSLFLIVLTSLTAKGITDQKEVSSILKKGGLICLILCTLVYGGLFYMGVCMSGEFGPDVNSTFLVTEIARRTLGTTGQVLLAVIVTLACITTAAGTVGTSCSLLSQATKNKIKYEWVAIAICVAATLVSTLGVSNILMISMLPMAVFTPPIVVGIFLTLFTKRIESDWAFKLSAWVSVAAAALDLFGVGFMKMMPFASLGLGWVLPAAIAAVIGYFIPDKKKAAKKAAEAAAIAAAQEEAGEQSTGDAK